MNPETTAVTRLIEIVAARPDLSEGDIYAGMAQAGIPKHLADRAYKFTLIAWGRIFLEGLGIHFSEDYLWLEPDGTIIEEGLIADEACYQAASQLASQYIGTPAFKRLALSAAEVHVVNDALNRGSKPEDLVTAPAIFFTASPTQEGGKRAHELMRERLKIPKSPDKPGE